MVIVRDCGEKLQDIWNQPSMIRTGWDGCLVRYKLGAGRQKFLLGDGMIAE
jgi:hypothetical protein